MGKQNVLFGVILLLLAGSLGQVISQNLECDLSFQLPVTNPSNIVEFVGLTASEKGDAGSNITGSVLTCSCSAISGLSPALWLGHSGSAVSEESFELTAGIIYVVVADHPGTAVQLHTTNNTFTCAEAGNYTCVIGENRRQVLVLPVGVECGLTNVTVTASPDRPLVNGEAVTLQCSAVDPTGSGLSFQWFKDDLLIPGQSSSALVLSAAGQNDTGRYTCQVSHRLGTREVMFDLFLGIQAPSQVTGVALFKAVRQGRPILRVTWTTPQSDVTISQYTLQYRRNGSTVWGSQVTAPPSATSTILTGLEAGTEYNVRMRAVSAAGDGMWSVVQTERTFDNSGNAALILTTFNETTCFDVPLYLHCHHPDTSSHIEGNPVFGSLRVHWKRDRAVIAVDGSTYTIAQQSRNLTVLAITHRREDFRETTNSYFSCFIPLEDGTFLHSNEVQTYLNVSNARLYNWTIFGKTLDWSLIVACSSLITPTTIFNVTVTLPSANGTERHTFISNETRIHLNVSLPHDEGIGVSLQILEYEAEPVHFHLNSSEMYACLGETYKMNCTMTESFHSCNISIPSWYKDGKEFVCFDDSNCTMKPKGNQIEELSENISHSWSEHVYYCAAYHSPFPRCQHQSNNFTVPLLRRPLRPELNIPIPGATTLSFTWTHNNVCFSECMYNISWWDPFESVYVVVDGTNYTIDGLQPGSDYNVTICAVCEGVLNCTEPQQYRTIAQEPGLSTGGIASIVVVVLAIGIAVLVIIILFKLCPKIKEKVGKLFTRQPKKEEEQQERST